MFNVVVSQLYCWLVVVQGMKKRDGGHEVDTKCLFMTDGASPSVHRVIELLTRNCDDAFLTPIPQSVPVLTSTLHSACGFLIPFAICCWVLGCFYHWICYDEWISCIHLLARLFCSVLLPETTCYT